MKGVFKSLLRPIRRLVTRMVISEDLPVVRMVKPIDLAAGFVCAENIPGDYLEFGVFRGDSFVEAYHKLESSLSDWASVGRAYSAYTDPVKAGQSLAKLRTKPAVRYFAFDSFEGLPPPSGIDANHPRFSEGRFDCGENEFLRMIKDRGVDTAKVVTVPGYYDRSLTEAAKRRLNLSAAAVIMVDCDLYESARVVLDFITDLVQDGTVIIFDDWFCFRGNSELGEQRACREWLARNPHLSLTPHARWGPMQQSFIVTKRAKAGV